jgi:hypothetical protein
MELSAWHLYVSGPICFFYGFPNSDKLALKAAIRPGFLMAAIKRYRPGGLFVQKLPSHKKSSAKNWMADCIVLRVNFFKMLYFACKLLKLQTLNNRLSVFASNHFLRLGTYA